LAIIKGTSDGKVVHVGISARRHLKLLDRADTALGMQNSNRHILLTPQTMNSSGSSLIHNLAYYRNQATT
jgi:peptidyl-tRNA hydrolase